MFVLYITVSGRKYYYQKNEGSTVTSWTTAKQNATRYSYFMANWNRLSLIDRYDSIGIEYVQATRI